MRVTGRTEQGYPGAPESEKKKKLDVNPYSVPDEVSSLVNYTISPSWLLSL